MKVALLTIFMLQVLPGLAQGITGQWKVSWDLTVENTSAEDLQKFEQAAQVVKDRTRQGIETRHYNFQAAGVMSLSWMGPSGERNNTGTWIFDANTGMLTIDINGDSRAYNVNFITESKIVIEAVEKPETMLFPKTVLLKFQN